MTKERQNVEIEKNQLDKNTDAAWQRLMATLEQEPHNDFWERMDREGSGIPVSAERVMQQAKPQDGILHTQVLAEEAASVQGETHAAAEGKRSRSRRNIRARKWAALGLAACVAAAVVITPVGNKALASILGQFRMEQVTEVNERDLDQLFNAVYQSGISEQEINRFGTFTVDTGEDYEELTPAAAAAAAGIPPVESSLIDKQETIYVGSGSKISLKLNVNEMNKAMKQLGASKLFPAGINGKTITVDMAPTVNYSLAPMENEDSPVSLSQMKVPTLTVADTADVSEVLEAVLQFPLLPERIKNSLTQSTMLTTGGIPLPVLTDERAVTEQMTVGQTKVLMNTYDYPDEIGYEATWVKDGVLSQAMAYVKKDNKEAVKQFKQTLQELIGQ